MASLYELLRKYGDQPRPTNLKDIRFLLEDLIDLKNKIVLGADTGHYLTLVQDIKNLGVVAKVKDIDNRPLTERQWLCLYKTMYKVFNRNITALSEPNTNKTQAI
jgi:hypothetical protein